MMADDITTSRLHLRVATREMLLVERDAPDTLPALLDVCADPSWEPLPAFVLKMMFNRADERDENKVLWPAFYVTLRAENLLIGGVGFKGLPTGLPRDGEVEIGYGLAPAQWGNGYATEAVAALCQRAFERGIGRVCADVAIDNDASMRVLSKNGFVRMGLSTAGEARWAKS